jgi:hypothetical protein
LVWYQKSVCIGFNFIETLKTQNHALLPKLTLYKIVKGNQHILWFEILTVKAEVNHQAALKIWFQHQKRKRPKTIAKIPTMRGTFSMAPLPGFSYSKN